MRFTRQRRGTHVRYLALGLVAATLSACATSEGNGTGADGDLLQAPRQADSLSERIRREGQGDGCLVAGNAGRNRNDGLLGTHNPCRDLRDVIAPPEPPPGIEIPPPPPPLPEPVGKNG